MMMDGVEPMRFAMLITAVVALIVGTSSPVTAQGTSGGVATTLKLFYWNAPLTTSVNPGGGAFSVTDSGTGWGGYVRFDSRRTPWGVSLRYDTVNIQQSVSPWNQGAVFDANVHYRFDLDINSGLSLFGGYGVINLNSPGGGSNASGRGIRLGIDFLIREPPRGWYFSGTAAFGLAMASELTGVNGTANGNAYDVAFAVGYEFGGGLGLEAGWKWYNWRIPYSPGCLFQDGCNTKFSGFVAGVTYRN